MVGNKPYLPPKEWEKQPNDDLPESITFASGDFFMQGNMRKLLFWILTMRTGWTAAFMITSTSGMIMYF